MRIWEENDALSESRKFKDEMPPPYWVNSFTGISRNYYRY